MRFRPSWLLGVAVALLWTPTPLLAQDQPATLEVELHLEAQKETASAAQPTLAPASVQLRSLQHDEVIEALVAVPGRARFTVDLGNAVELRVEVPGFWASARIVHVAEPAMVVPIRLRPTAAVTARVTVPQGHSLPEALEVRFQSAPDAPAPLDGEYSLICPLTDGELTEGELRCEIPAGSLDLHFRAPGFITAHRWGVSLSPHQRKEIGVLELRPGASVVGRVTAVGEDFDPQAVEIELLPNRAGLALDDARRPGALKHRVRANSRGFYELTEIPPGSYTLVALHAGYAPARLKPVRVQEGVELELRTLELERPRSLVVRLAPPRDPFGKPWRIRLLQPGGLPGQWSETATDTPDEQGVVQVSGLMPSLHRLEILDRRGAVWHAERIELTASTNVLEVELPFQRLEARVTLAGEPLEARVIFRGIEQGQAIAKDSDAEGKVYVFLPDRDGPWDVDVESDEPTLRARVEDLRVEKAPDEPWAKAEIEVPDTRIFGVVVDEQGLPVPGALVDIRGPGRWASEQVLARGSNAQFELRGYPAGLWNLEARHQEAKDAPSFSAPLTEVLVMENVPAGPVRLVARREQILHGRVVSPEGIGIPGTLVVAGLEQPERLTRSIQHRATGLDGHFTLRLPARVPAVQLQMFPPGFVAYQVRVELPRADPIVLQAETVGGTLIVQWAEEQRGRASSTESLKSSVALFGEFLFYNPYLDIWAGMHEVADDRRLVVPNLEPGTYTACLDVVEAAFDTGRLPVGHGERCVRGDLPPLGELVLELPVPAPPSDTEGPGQPGA